MARPGEVETRAPEDAPHGEGADLQRIVQAAPLPRRQPPQLERGGQEPPLFAPPSPEPLQLDGDTTGYDHQLFAPSDRPSEPVTHGAPFGPGANFVPQPGEDQRTFMVRVAQALQSSPAATADVQGFAARVLRGE